MNYYGPEPADVQAKLPKPPWWFYWSRRETAWGQVWFQHTSGGIVLRRSGDLRYTATMPDQEGDLGYRWTVWGATRLVEQEVARRQAAVAVGEPDRGA